MTNSTSAGEPRRNPPEAEAVRKQATQGLSNLAARILDQLSVTSWLPSAVLVLALVFLGNLTAHETDMGSALRSFLSIGFGQVAAVFAMVAVATVLTQAFEFESIRLLEGYWGMEGFRCRVANRSRSHYRRRHAQLHRDGERTRAEAAKTAVAEIERRKISAYVSDCDALLRWAEAVDHAHRRWVIDGWKLRGKAKRRHGELVHAPQGLSTDDAAVADDEWWEPYADPDLLAQYNLRMKQLRAMPGHAYRVLPTRLGNVLRAYEERVAPPGTPDVERYIQRQIGDLPPDLLEEHDQFRSRLDLYCSLVVVSMFVAFVGLVMAPLHLGSAAVWFLSWTAMSALSYRAAIASADGYGSVLLSIKERSDQLLSEQRAVSSAHVRGTVSQLLLVQRP